MTIHIIVGSANSEIGSLSFIANDFLNATGSAGYTYVETVAVNSNTWTIVKNSSANNGVMDYHIALGIGPGSLTTGGYIGVCLFEEWNSSSKTAGKFAPFSASAVAPTWAVESPSYLPGSSNLVYTINFSPKSGFDYYFFSKKKSFVLTSRTEVVSASTYNIKSYGYRSSVIGLYESFGSSSQDPAPLFILQVFSAQTLEATRVPGVNGDLGYQEFECNDGRSTRAALESSNNGFMINLVALTHVSIIPNIYTKRHIFSKAAIVQPSKSSPGADYKKDIRAIRGISEDFYYGCNSDNAFTGSPNLQTQWTFANCSYLGRNVNHGSARINISVNALGNRPEGMLIILE